MKAASTSRRVNRKSGLAARRKLSACVFETLESRQLLEGKIPYSGPACYSDNPIRYGDGVVKIEATDLMSGAFGTPFGHARSWSNQAIPSIEEKHFNGNDWRTDNLPYLLEDHDDDAESPLTTDVIDVMRTGTDHLFFNKHENGSYIQKFETLQKLSHNTSTHEFVLTDEKGYTYRFFDFSTSVTPEMKRGRFKSMTDPEGNSTTATYEEYVNTGLGISRARLDKVARQDDPVTPTRIEEFDYAYEHAIDSGSIEPPDFYFIESITWTHTVETTEATIRTATYEYYDGSSEHGSITDLKRVTIEDASGNDVDTHYYWYYVDGDEDPNGYAGGLQLVFGPESYERLKANVANFDTAADLEDVQQYADHYFEYTELSVGGTTWQPVSKEIAQGAGCSACTGGLGTFEYIYTHRGSDIDSINDWQMKTKEYLPDGTPSTLTDNDYNVYYTNPAQAPLIKIFHDTSANRDWITAWQYNDKGQETIQAHPSAVSTTSETGSITVISDGTTYYIRPSTGFVEVTDYGTSTTATSSTAGDVLGYPKARKVKQGGTGSAITLESTEYIEKTAGGVTIYPVKYHKNYRTGSGETTTLDYTWHGSTVQMASMTTTLPSISSDQNGPGSSSSTVVVYDVYGRETWSKDEDGHITFRAYDDLSGAVTTLITDVDTDLVTGEPWSNSDGMHYVTSNIVDSLGRVRKQTDPDGRITYTVFDDTADDSDPREMRVYRGWNTSTHTTTGPIEIVREYRGQNYTEYLTVAVSPGLTGSNEPNGSETFTGNAIQTMRRDRVNNANQRVNIDRYFDIPTTYSSNGTEGTNYWRTSYGYDWRGRLNRTFAPTKIESSVAVGTITRTVFDGLNRIESQWVGTDDTDATHDDPDGPGTGSNNMKIAAEYDFDDPSDTITGSGAGDGNLTRLTEYRNATDVRTTRFSYDWRDRLVASKIGAEASESSGTGVNRQIIYREYDNLNHVRFVEQYDGDNVGIYTDTSPADGIPDRPSASLMNKKTENSFDDMGRLYSTKEYIEPTNSSNMSGLVTNYFYDRRNNLIKTDAPGGLITKHQYDGVGRLSKTFQTDDAGGDTIFGDADDVVGDHVLEQVETQYDKSGNPIFTITKQRFHDETATGELDGPLTGDSPKARISYSENFYDRANRLEGVADLGTNGGGTALTSRPDSSVPTRSPTVLVTSYLYNSAGWVETTTDPRNIAAKTFYDDLGRTIQTIESYVNGVMETSGTDDEADDRITDYSYDGSDHLILMKANLPGTNVFQKTQYIYEATTTGGSDFNSRHLLTEVRYPDLSSGEPSTTLKEIFKYNRLTEKKSFADRAGTTHTYTYDIVGRLTDDSVIGALGSGVDTAVQKLSFTYDSAGRPEKFISKNSSSTAVNEVKREYNTFGQLTKEYQEHSGTVSTSTSLKVQYAYSELSGGNHSRRKSMTYPNNRVLHYRYGTTNSLNDNVSRIAELASLSSGGTVFEGYTYLGLGTFVQRTRASGDLTYIKQGSESVGSAGDQYTGLDRFGRVIGQRWIKGGAETDWFMYGYDENNNRLFRANLVDQDFGELYTTWIDEQLGSYDSLDRLTDFSRGTLEMSGEEIKVFQDSVRTQDWNLDALGNWKSITNDGGTPETRTHNLQNQISNTPYTYDGNGNLRGENPTTRPGGKIYTYDAWNRLTGHTVLASSQVADATQNFKYDALGRRIQEGPITFSGQTSEDTAANLYYSDKWQLIHEQKDVESGGGGDQPDPIDDPAGPGGGPDGGFYTVQTDYVWSEAYVDAMVLRDRDVDLSPSNGLEQRLYVQQDANFNTTAILEPDGDVIERYIYDPYGAFSVLNPDWSADTSGTDFGWVYLHQGGRYESHSGLYHFRNRDDDAELGRWIQQDPITQQVPSAAPVIIDAYARSAELVANQIGNKYKHHFWLHQYADGANLYQYVRGNPQGKTDPSGLVAPAAIVAAIGGGIAAACGFPYYIAAMTTYRGTTGDFKHCWVTCMIARQCGSGAALAGDVAKELGDMLRGDSLAMVKNDMAANNAGLEIAGKECVVGFGIVGRWFRQSCKDGCNARGYR